MAMKKCIIINTLMLSTLLCLQAQEPAKSRRERRAERQEKRMNEVKEMIHGRSFIFEATHAMPLGGGSIHLNHSFDVELNGDTLTSYLPFFGVAYRVEYGSRSAGLDFTQPVQSYEMEEKDDGYLIKLEVKNKMDLLNYTFFISHLGFATLNVTSTNRQAISYYGRIEDDLETE
jgi:hypothetical protein